MAKSRSYWIPFFYLAKKEILRCVKVLNQTIWTPIVTAFLYFLIFGVSMGRHLDGMTETPYLIFLIPGLVMLTCLNSTFQNASSGFTSSKFTGEIEDYKILPIPSFVIFSAVCVGSLFRGYIVSFVVYLCGAGFAYSQFGELFFPVHFWILMFFITMGGLIYSVLGAFISLYCHSFDQVTAFTNFIMTPLIFLGGVFYSINDLPVFWQWVSKFNPVVYLINGVRYGFLGQSDVPLQTSAIASVIIFVVLFGLLNIYFNKCSFRKW